MNTLQLKRSVAGSIILVLHLHTLVLEGSVRAHWPEAVQRMLACLALDYTCFADPACFYAVTSATWCGVGAVVGASLWNASVDARLLGALRRRAAVAQKVPTEPAEPVEVEVAEQRRDDA